MEKFGCTSPFGGYFDNICTENVTGKQALDLFEKLDDKRHFIRECPYPCESVKLSAFSLTPRGQHTGFKLKFDQYVKVTEAYVSYTELELLAEFGGYVGLFLGLSVFDINKIIMNIINYFRQ